MRIRTATAKDLNECAKISHIPEFTYLKGASDRKAKSYLKEFYDKGILLVAEDKNEIIGFINAEFMLGSFVWVDGITVKNKNKGSIGKL